MKIRKRNLTDKKPFNTFFSNYSVKVYSVYVEAMSSKVFGPWN